LEKTPKEHLERFFGLLEMLESGNFKAVKELDKIASLLRERKLLVPKIRAAKAKGLNVSKLRENAAKQEEALRKNLQEQKRKERARLRKFNKPKRF